MRVDGAVQDRLNHSARRPKYKAYAGERDEIISRDHRLVLRKGGRGGGQSATKNNNDEKKTYGIKSIYYCAFAVKMAT